VSEQLRADAIEALKVAQSNGARLEAIGFELDEFGEYRVENAKVILYPARCKVGDEWVAGYEIEIDLPNGALGFDVPQRGFHVAAGPAQPPPGAIPYEVWRQQQEAERLQSEPEAER
jgi:hypothetical protein